MNFDGVEKIAAAILYEGYILYPYRPTAIKNRQRWNFGTLYPCIYAEAQRPEEPFRLIVECLAIADAEATLDIKINFLQLQQGSSSSAAPALLDPSLAWDEAAERSWVHSDLRIAVLLDEPLAFPLAMEDAGLRALLSIRGESFSEGLTKLHIEFSNVSELAGGAAADREEALPRSFVSAHVLLGITGGEFISILEADPRFKEAVAACHNCGVFPVLVGEEPARDRMLCSPIILYDYPKIAPESEGDFFDGTEMDEMLTLRVLTLTDAEKEEMRSGDARARRILERTEALTPEAMSRAHGVVREIRAIREDAV